MYVHTEIVCQRIIPSTMGPMLLMSVATVVEQLSQLVKLCYSFDQTGV